MTRSLFPVWCKGSIGDFRSSGAGSNPATGSIDPHDDARHAPRITALTATLAVLALALFPAQVAFAEEGLPDGRVYEKVTPTENKDADVYVPHAFNGGVAPSQGTETRFPFQVAVDGSAVTYQADPTNGGYGAAGNGLGNQYIAQRNGAGSWSQEVIQPPAVSGSLYGGFASDLSVGVVASGGLTVGPPGFEKYQVLYSCAVRVSACGVGVAGEPAPVNPYRALFGKPENRTPGEFGTNDVYTGGNDNNPIAVLAGGSAGFSDMAFEANDALLGGGGVLGGELDRVVSLEIRQGENNNYLYESVGGQLELVDVLPGGEIARGATFGSQPFTKPGVNPPAFSGVVSGDGRRVYWSDGAGVVYVRVDGMETVQVSAHAAQYWTSADDGRYAFYTEGGTLYRFDIEGGSRVVFGASGVVGVIGAGEDGGSVYFVSLDALGSGGSGEGGNPVPGSDNLYLSRVGGTPVFIATLSSEDGSAVEPFITSLNIGRGEFGDWQPGLGQRTARVSSGGGSVVFMSDQRLPVVGFPAGFPNNGLDEVYLYQAASNQLFCTSCSSSGEPPAGGEEGAAAFLPISWSDTYLPEWVSGDGDRVFFDTALALVPQDTNGAQDVYEWEREGTGSCTSATAVNGGCIYLLSGGTSPAFSWFIGASGSGDSAFIATRAQLVGEDQNDAYDLYDVQVGGVVPVSSPACTGTGCQGVPGAPPTFATPSSVTFEGPGNFPAPAAAAKPAAGPKAAVKKTVKCAKHKKLVHGRCVKQKRRHRHAE